MTPNKSYEDERDSILEAFLRECPEPTPTQIAEWRGRYPNYAAEIMNLAADLLFLSNNRGSQDAALTPDEIAREDEAAIKSFRDAQCRIKPD